MIQTKRLTLALLALLLAATAASAQLPGLSTPPEGEQAAPVPVPAERSSPRATMKAFLEAFYLDDPSLEAAAACLDLSDLPDSLRASRGREYATQLKDVIDRTRLVNFETIPDDPKGPPYVFLRNQDGEIVISRSQAGEWLFSAGTLSSLPDLFDSVRDEEVVEGVEVMADRDLTPGLWLQSRMPESMRTRTFLLEQWQWLALLVLAIVGVLLDRVVTFLLRAGMTGWLRSRLLTVDNEILVSGLRPLGLFVMGLLWWLSLAWLALPVGVLQVLSIAVHLVLTVSVVWAVYRLVDIVSAVVGERAATTDSKLDDLLVPMVRKSLKVFVAAFGLVFIADNLQVNVSSLLAGLGLGGIAFALAAQDTVKNIFGSLTVLLDRPFAVGDWVQIGSVEGVVEEVGIRSTRVRTFYNSQITLPNANLISANVDNFGARTFRRWKTTLSLTYQTPPESIEAFCAGLRELIQKHPYTRKDYYEVHFNSFGAASLDVLVYMFFQTPDWSTELRERHRLGLDILRLAEQLGVEFAYPTQTLYLRRPADSVPAEVEGYEDRMRSWRERGRESARALLDASLGGRVPPPVGSEQRGEADV